LGGVLETEDGDDLEAVLEFLLDLEKRGRKGRWRNNCFK